jgi:integrase
MPAARARSLSEAEEQRLHEQTRLAWEKSKANAKGEMKPVERKRVEVPIFAGNHSLRRAFGSIWSRRVMPPVLKKLMRHADISTTLKYYVTLDSDDLGQELWKQFGPKSDGVVPVHSESTDSSQGGTDLAS